MQTLNERIAEYRYISKIKLILSFCISIFCIALMLLYTYFNQVMVKGCLWWECAPARSFDVTDLGLPPDLFPDNSRFQPMVASYSQNTSPVLKSGVQTIEWNHGDVRYSVTIHPTHQRSSDDYRNLKEHLIHMPGVYQSLSAAPDLSQAIYTAEAFFVQCGTLFSNRKDCTWIAQYQEFGVYFSTTISDELTSEDFQEIVAFIDHQMAEHIYKR